MFGVPIQVSYGWLFLFALATFFMALIQLPLLFPDVPLLPRLAAGVVFSLLFFGSVLFHELAHGVVALANGLRVTSITLLIFGGFTAVETQTSKPGTEAWVAIAGPVASLFLSTTLFVLAFALGLRASLVGTISEWLALINLALVVTNILPGFPLDGGRVLQALLWRATGSHFRGTMGAISAGQTLAFIEIVIGLLLLFSQTYTLAAWFLLVGFFLRNAARQSRRRAIQVETLRSLTAQDAMERQWPRVQSSTNLRTLGDDEEFIQGRRSYLVYDRDDWVGMIAVRAVRALEPGERARFRVSDLMVHRAEVLEVGPQDPLLTVLETLEAGRIGYVPVLAEGQVRGVLSRQRVLDLVEERSPMRRNGPRPT